MQSISQLGPYAELVSRGGGRAEIVFEDGATRLAGGVRLRAAPWVLVVGMPSAEVLRETRAHLLVVGGAALALAILAVVAAVRLSARQASGFARLRQAMARLEAGDPPASVPVTVGGEAGALTERFNRILSWVHGKLREHEAVSQVQEAADQVVTGERSVDAILPGLLRRLVGGVGADMGVLVLQDESGLVARAGVGLPGVAVEGVRLRRGQGLAAAVVSERGPVVVPDVEADYRVEEAYLKTTGVRSVAALPLLVGDDLIGAVVVGHRRPHVFAPDEVQRLEAIVRRTAQAIGRARALDAFQRSAQGLEAQLAAQVEALQKSAAEQAEARQQAQEARKHAQELEQRIKAQAAEAPRVKEVIVEREVVRPAAGAGDAARVRAEMQKTVSEELRAPLTALLELPRFLVDGLQKPLGEAERAQLDILQERSQEIVELIEGLAVWTALQSGGAPGARAATDLAGLVQRVVRALQPRASARGNRIEVDVKPGTGQVVTDVRRLEQILKNLLLSAIKFTEVGEIRVTCYQGGGETVITVADDGIGFTPEEQARIFRPFLSVGPRGGRSLPGTGLLLAVAERLAAAIGGKIRVESELDRGTWVTVTLPTQG
jgi:signal transduction histidine kinase/HAMP domain-containing protein